MTDKELKKLSKLELLELLLTESRENERLRAELEQIKQENAIKKSAKHLNKTSENLGEASEKLTTALEQVYSIINGLDRISVASVETTQDLSEDKAEQISTEATAVKEFELQVIDEPEKTEAVEQDIEADGTTTNQRLNDISNRLDTALKLISSRIKELDKLADIADVDEENASFYNEK